MDVSIIIVNFNTKELLKQCICSIYKHTSGIEFEIIVSDNKSSDESVKMINNHFPDVIVIENSSNIGFGSANNAALKVAQGEYIFYLNSDTILLNNAVKIFHDYWELSPIKEKIGALGSNLIDMDEDIIQSYGDFPTISTTIKKYIITIRDLLVRCFFFDRRFYYKIIKKIKVKNKIQSKEGPVDYITGADLFMHNDSYACFDENFFLYFEEVDLQLKMALIEKLRLLIVGPEIIHLEGKSNATKNTLYTKSSSYHESNISQIKYFQKHYPNKKIFIFLIKLLIILIYLNPIVFSKTYKKIRDIIICKYPQIKS